MRSALLMCGVLAAVIYVATDVAASILYPGYSFTDQAVSELFAIGGPTSRLVVPFFSLSSTLLMAFAFGVWMSTDGNRWLRLMATTLLASALTGLALWNFFPMHLRGAQRSLTDTMHLILATNPFVLLSLVCGVAGFRSWFRFYTAATILVLVIPAVFAFLYARQIEMNEPTPWLGLSERFAQYGYLLWQVATAMVLLRKGGRAGEVLSALNAASAVTPNNRWRGT